jgi:predicted dehydrogenase
MVHVGVIGCGYWGPNLIRNFVACEKTRLVWACDLDVTRLDRVLKPYPEVKPTTDLADLLTDKFLDAVAIATPVHTHFAIASACLESGKHILVEKPFAASVKEGEALLALASSKGLHILCDHTFCYTGAVLKIKEIIQSKELGELYYFDAVRINLGLFQQDINVIWDLAPHDVSILDFIFDQPPVYASAHGISHARNKIENIAYITLGYANDFIAHFHVNWLSPVKIRRTIIGGSEKMLVWDDLDQADKIKIYDKGIEINEEEHEEKRRLLVSYRSGDMYAPHIERTEALSLLVKEFAQSIEEDRPGRTDGKAGIRVLRVLEAAQKSIKAGGLNFPINI